MARRKWERTYLLLALFFFVVVLLDAVWDTISRQQYSLAMASRTLNGTCLRMAGRIALQAFFRFFHL